MLMFRVPWIRDALQESDAPDIIQSLLKLTKQQEVVDYSLDLSPVGRNGEQELCLYLAKA